MSDWRQTYLGWREKEDVIVFCQKPGADWLHLSLSLSLSSDLAISPTLFL